MCDSGPATIIHSQAYIMAGEGEENAAGTGKPFRWEIEE